MAEAQHLWLRAVPDRQMVGSFNEILEFDMSTALSRLLSLFEATRQIDAAVRTAAEFARARDGQHPCTDEAGHAAAGVPL